LVLKCLRLGILFPGSPDHELEEWRPLFFGALEELGWVEGRNLSIEWRFAERDHERYAPLAHDLACAGMDALLVAGTPLTRALQDAAPTIPIITSVGDPVGSGFAKTLARPGGNVTGLSWALEDKARKQIELLREMAPTIQRLLILRSQRYGDISELNRCLEGVVRESGMAPEVLTIETLAQVDERFTHSGEPLTTAAFIYGHGSFQLDVAALAGIAVRCRVATVTDDRNNVEAGCLMSYTLRHRDQSRQQAGMLDKVLRGISPAEIAFELPTIPDLVINRTTAVALGIAIPRHLLPTTPA
jgi:putative tryptophan/tyrosine transport system substrate-binding protein